MSATGCCWSCQVSGLLTATDADSVASSGLFKVFPAVSFGEKGNHRRRPQANTNQFPFFLQMGIM